MARRRTPRGVPALDLENQCVWIDDRRAALTPKAFEVLRVLVERPGQLCTKRDLLDRVWPDTAVTESVLSVTIKQLRDVLGDEASAPRFIETRHRRGYCWIGDVSTVDSSERPPAVTAPEQPIHASLVGRAAQLAMLRSQFERAESGQAQLVFVTGEAGIGKTALVDTFVSAVAVERDDARGRATTVSETAPLLIRGQCLETFGSGEAYLPLLEALAQLAPQLGAEQLAEVLRRFAPTWLRQFPWLMTEIDRARSTAVVSRERMLREWCDAIEALVSSRPLILVIEDLHWSDPSTLAALELIAQRRLAAALLIVGTYRPVDALLASHGIGTLKHKLLQQRLCSEIPLWYLEEEDVAAYLHGRLRGAVDEDLTRTLQTQTEGHPLYLLNVVEQLQRRDDLVFVDDRWHLRQSDSAGTTLPEGLQQAIEHNLAQLPRVTARWLAAGSIAGVEFSAAAIAACVDAERDVVEHDLEAIAQRGGILRTAGVRVLQDRAVTGRFALVHTLYRKVLYDQMAAPERARLHRRYADWLAQEGGAAAELAHHYTLAQSTGCADQASRHHVEAAQHARRLCAWNEAIEHYQQALQLLATHLPSSPLFTTVLLALGDTQQQAGMIHRAREVLWQAVANARASGDGEALAQAALLIGHGYQRLGQLDRELEQLCEEALVKLSPQASALRARLLAHLAFLYSDRAGSDARRAQLGREAIDCARQVDDPAMMAWVLTYLRWSAWGAQDRASLAAELGQARALVPRIADPESRFMLLALIATDALELGEHEDYDAAIAQSRAVLADAPIPWCEWFAHRIETARALQQGELAQAERLAGETFEIGQRMDNPNVLPLFGAQTTCLRIVQGRFDEAAALVEMAVQGGTPGAAWLCVLAYLRCEQGRLAEAIELLDGVAAQDFTDVARDTTWLIGGAAMAMAFSTLGDAKRAARLYELLLPNLDRSPGLGSSVFGMGHMSRYLALLAETAGLVTQARHHFGVAIAAQEQLHAYPWLAFTEFDYARFLVRQDGRHDRAAELLTRAARRAAQLGMQGLALKIAALGDPPQFAGPERP